MTTDLFNHVSWNEYVNMKPLNFSKLKHMVGGARAYKHNLEHPIQQTPAMLLGNVIHKMVLEPDQFASEYSIWEGGLTQSGKPTMSKNSSAFRDFQALEASAGRTVIDQSMVDEAKAIRQAIMEHPTASKWLDGALVEQTVTWEFEGVKCKSRIDIINDGCICDLKTTVNAEPWAFQSQMYKMSYHAQMAFYANAWAQHSGDMLPCRILAVEKKAPYKIACYELDMEAIVAGEDMFTKWINELKQCQKNNLYPVKYPDAQRLSLPAYAVQELEAETSLIIGGTEVKI